MGFVRKLKPLWHHEVFWRYVDALSPRGFGFLLNTFVIVKFGAHDYALPAWIMSVASVLFMLVPDPTGYILVSGRPGARELMRLLAPWLYGKLVFIFGATIIVIHFAATTLVEAASASEAAWSVAGGLMFVGGELLWATCAVNQFAAGALSSWARLGLVLRLITLVSAILMTWLPGAFIGQALAIFSGPIVIFCLFNLGLPHRWRRCWLVGLGALRRYSLWTYLNGFLLNVIAQAPVLWAGSAPTVPPQVVGQLSYALRILNVMVQPLTILQSVLIRDFARDKSLAQPSYRHYRRLFRAAGFAIFGVALALAFTSSRLAGTDMIFGATLLLLGAGLGVLTFFRYEFALLNAYREARFLYRQAFLPTLFVSVAFYSIAYLQGTLLAVSAASACAYIVLAALIFRSARERLGLLQVLIKPVPQ
jgi:O-antigen/teichoic acid export membrane protein